MLIPDLDLTLAEMRRAREAAADRAGWWAIFTRTYDQPLRIPSGQLLTAEPRLELAKGGGHA